MFLTSRYSDFCSNEKIVHPKTVEESKLVIFYVSGFKHTLDGFGAQIGRFAGGSQEPLPEAGIQHLSLEMPEMPSPTVSGLCHILSILCHVNPSDVFFFRWVEIPGPNWNMF